MTDSASGSHDVVVVGGGHNGLTAALYLADDDRDVVVLEQNATVGGAVRSAELTGDGHVHDIYSTNQNLFLDSEVYADFGDDLRAHGLEFSRSDAAFANVFPDESALRVWADRERTLEEFRAHAPGDAEGWAELDEAFEQFARSLAPLLGEELPSGAALRTLASAVRREGLSDLLELAQVPLSSTRELGDAYFETPEAKALLACWGLHLDFGPDVSAGGMFPFLEAFTNVREGISVATGGASAIPEALAAAVETRGGEVRTDARADEILASQGTATGVRLDSGETIWAQEAVVANLTPTVLYDDLLGHHDFSDDFQSKVDRYEYGPGTMMVHLALDGPLDWAAGDLSEFAYVHVAPYVSNLANTYRDARDGWIPEEPLLVVGQTTAADPSRTPDDTELLWVQVRALPSEIRGDAAGEIAATDWADAKGPVADRVLDKLERYAPGVREQVTGRVVLSPTNLEAQNPNLVGGDSVAGSHHLRQNFLWRPFPGYSRHDAPLDDLYVCGASTWPGAGNNATSGRLAAERVLSPNTSERAFELADQYLGDTAEKARRWLQNR